MTKFLFATALVLILQSLLPVVKSAEELQASIHQRISRASSLNGVAVATQSMLMEDKIRLGSTPPSCHNRCNECNPCMAVQVPTLPGPKGRPLVPMNDESPYKRYPNYKPLGWKCRCGNRLFNP